MFNLEQLAAFVAAVESGSFSAAARRLGKSQSSVSIGVNNLELDLGVTLFDRSTKYPTLTVQGERLYEQTKVVLRQADRLQSYAKGVINGVEDTIKIGIDPLVPFSVIDTALEKVAQVYPYIQVQIVKLFGDELNNAILDESVQLGLHLSAQAVPVNLEFAVIANIEWVCICSPDSEFADKETVYNEDLINFRQIVCSSMLENNAVKSIALLSQEVWQAEDQDDVIRLVEQGLGWAYAPKSMALEKEATGSLIVFSPEFKCEELYYSCDLIWKASAHYGPALQFILQQLTAK
ncbi:LysR family transcriptional regulator [Photobacterium sanguinicancri]|uniref:LysR family transcriptional regulator n=1 Tax=Photobacterium sanguinicancri TaxID=875932 RepID=A0AAW7Y9H0_9GAMM|nr:LysR family transcriptional regulator [Photobacterium sanguinicancri]MDO6543409.1 LysR family transcriptional regulator [Photobacterium sanguinicancri]